MQNLSLGHQQQVAEALVGDYFEVFPLEVFSGKVTTGEVVTATLLSLSGTGVSVSKQAVYDAIRYLGPEGEGDVKWLRVWGGERVVWTEDGPTGCEKGG